MSQVKLNIANITSLIVRMRYCSFSLLSPNIPGIPETDSLPSPLYSKYMSNFDMGP
jgi:hypothetical protein